MREKIFILLICCLMLMFSSASITEVNAQRRNLDNQTRPNNRAKKLMAQGDQFFKLKDYRSAVSKYAEAISISPNFPVAHYWKGYAHYYLNEFDQGVEELDLAFNQGFPKLAVYKLRWYLNFQRENFDAALNDIQAGLQIEPTNSDFNIGLAEILVRKGSYQEAIEPLKRAILGNPNNGDLHYFLAISYGQTGDSVQQSASAEEAIKRNTKYVGESYKLIGDALFVAKKPVEAIDAYQKALNVKPDFEDVYVNLANLYQNQNRLGEAIQTAGKGLKLYPKNSILLIGLTWYFSLADRHAEAVNAGLQAVKTAPDNHMAYTNLCRAYNDMKEYPQAVLNCNKALKLNPTDGETFFYLGRAYDSLNKKDTAKQYYKKAVEGLLVYTRANAEYADGYYLLGNAYYSNGQQTAEAIKAYKRSLELSPNFVKAHFNLGNMYVASNNLPAAREQYDILLKLDKNYAGLLKQNIDSR